ncbi:hypothetical protein DPMN_135890 [Dreissena polymorpha]|uniref:Uncharacterized protein n=1 Tax=Dreissena polymorpha TaxID=45954 RepID=A0A9D4JDB1_DREPO|nr:hypothetical protein DPMN_135890 [Dreissena polymorpha]
MIADKYESVVYLVIDQPNVDIPVYRIRSPDRAENNMYRVTSRFEEEKQECETPAQEKSSTRFKTETVRPESIRYGFR